MSSIVLITGIPGAGKSTVSKKLCQAHFPEPVQCFSLDEFVEEHLKEVEHEEMPAAKYWRQLWEDSVLKEIASVQREQCHLVDDIFYLQSQRRPFRKFAARNGFKFCVLKVECDVSEAVLRNKMRGKAVPVGLEVTDEMIESIHQRFEGREEMVFINSDESAEVILDKLKLKLSQIVIPQQPHSVNDQLNLDIDISTSNSQQQQLNERKSRQVTGRIIRSGWQSQGKLINDLRRQYLQESSGSFDELELENFIMKELEK